MLVHGCLSSNKNYTQKMNTRYDVPVCPDWIFLNTSNVNVAKDRAWFKTYTPFASLLKESLFTSPGSIPVLGIGTVELPTKRSPNRTGVSAHGTLLLKDVLHVPDFICNVVGSCFMYDGYRVVIGNSSRSNGSIQDGQGVNMAYFDPDRPLYCIKLRNQPGGPRLGPHVLRHDELYMISCRWDPSEKQRWLDYKAGNSLVPGRAFTTSTNPPYTDAEKSYLKANWGNEWRFLTQHGLKIHNDEDREEGRTILRAMMRDDPEESSDEEFEDDDEFGLNGHQADFNFSEKQLDWIEEHYGNSERFLISFGLKFYNDEDIEEGKAIVDSFMNDED